MFAQRGLPDPAARIAGPLLALTGEQDIEVMRSAAVSGFLSPLCDRLTVTAIADSGHYPMQEAPPLLVAIIERFLTGDLAVAALSS
jgi:pimeloyl-ACP methyl ester carboxylesterase